MTNAEKRHLDLVANLGCIVCRNLGHGQTPAEIHHKRAGTGLKRANHYQVIPLCHQHHRTGGYGVAIHAGIKKWTMLYGTEEELIAQVNELIEKGYL